MIPTEKEIFIKKLEESKTFGDPFDNIIPQQLAKIFFETKRETLTLNWKRGLQQELREFEEEYTLDQGLGDTKELLNRVLSDNFTQGKPIKNITQKNIYQVFTEFKQENSFENKEHRHTIVRRFRKRLKDKIREISSENDRIYFMKYSGAEIQREEGKYILSIEIPAPAKGDIARFGSFYDEKFKKDYLSILKTNRNQNIPIAREKIQLQRKFNSHFYGTRKQEIGNENYKPYQLGEETGKYVSLDKKNNFLMDFDTVPERQQDILLHSGNQMAHALLQDRYTTRTNINRDDKDLLFFSKETGTGKTTLVKDTITQLQKRFPALKIKWQTGNLLYKAYSNAYMIRNNENKSEWERRTIQFRKEFYDLNVLIIDDIEQLNNKIMTQRFLIQLMIERPNIKMILISNKDINNLRHFPVTENGLDEEKAKGFTYEFKGKLEQVPRAEIYEPRPAECGPFLEKELKNIGVQSISTEKIYTIAKLLPHTNQYKGLAREIGNICQYGKNEFTLDMAKQILRQRNTQLYEATPEDIQKIVTNYVLDNFDCPKSEQEIIQKYTAFFLKKITLHKDERSYEKIAEILGIKKIKVVKYLRETIGNEDGHLLEMERRIGDFIQKKGEETVSRFRQ